MKVQFDNVGQLPDVARKLLEAFPDDRFFAFFGSMGVGKTTLIKEICTQLGVEDVVCSPTFAIVNEYSRPVRGKAAGETAALQEPVYHFDFYRLKTLGEAYDLGYEEYFYSGFYCFTEWTEKVGELLPERYVRVDIAESNGVRTLVAERKDN